MTGTHAEFIPKRPLCRVRVRVTSDDARFHTFTTGIQRLKLADGSLISPSPDAMHVKRQPAETELGARNALEVDLWFEPPVGAEPVALRVFGDSDPDPQGTTVKGAGPRFGEVPLHGLGKTGQG